MFVVHLITLGIKGSYRECPCQGRSTLVHEEVHNEQTCCVESHFVMCKRKHSSTHSYMRTSKQRAAQYGVLQRAQTVWECPTAER